MKRQRQHIRWQIGKEINLKLLGDNLLIYDCLLNDISIQGAKISLNQKLPSESSLSLNIGLAGAISLNGLETRIIWRKEKAGSNTYGFCFHNIGEINKDRICAFVYQNFPDNVKEPPWRKR